MDKLLTVADTALRTLFAAPRSSTACPAEPAASGAMTAQEKAHAAGLMRVNHVGEVCAQALYTGQAFATKNEALRAQMLAAGVEETGHLAWTKARLDALGGRVSWLNPLWYAGALGLGFLAGKLGDATSLGFVVETERQVGAHLQSHLETGDTGLPESDLASRAIVAQMRDDELRHAQDALDAGAVELPMPVRNAMRSAAKVMTTLAYRI